MCTAVKVNLENSDSGMVCSVPLRKGSTFFSPLKSNTLCAKVEGVAGLGCDTGFSTTLAPLQPNNEATAKVNTVVYNPRNIVLGNGAGFNNLT